METDDSQNRSANLYSASLMSKIRFGNETAESILSLNKKQWMDLKKTTKNSECSA